MTKPNVESVLSANRAGGIGEIEGEAAMGSGERARVTREEFQICDDLFF
jgi:hypothetical protein